MTVEEPTKRRAILIFVLNRPGVLNKISMLIRRKMYNVETVTACRTHRPGISRMTLYRLMKKHDFESTLRDFATRT